MRVVLTGGGTGGHIYPALAIAKEIGHRESAAAFLYIGTAKGLEATLVPRTGIPFEAIDISGIKRKLTWENVSTIWKFFRAVSHSKKLLRDFRPDVVIGTGGYVCGPVVYAAHTLGIRTMIHEQNVVPGLTNKFLARYTNDIVVSFEESLGYFSKTNNNVAYIGNPRASEVMQGDAKAGRESLRIDPDKRIVLIVGGSRGARPINEAMRELINQLADFPDCHFVYITGEIHFETVAATLPSKTEQPRNLSVLPYVHNMPDLLAATHLIVNRAGASTLAEITALGIPAILIPSPYVTNNHQEKNARGLEREGAAVVLLEKDLNHSSLKQAFSSILNDQSRWETMRQNSLRMGKPDAAQALYQLLRMSVE